MDVPQLKADWVAAGLPPWIVDEVVEAYVEAKRRFHLGDHRPHAVEGGRFSEAVFRLMQHDAGLAITPLGKTLASVDTLQRSLENVIGVSDSVRLHIPRTLKLVYDIRNKRDTAHLGDGIDPNLQDASLVVGCMDWVMAELVRLHHGISADQAQGVIADLVTREVPVVQEIAGQPVLLSDLQARDQALLMLYRAGARGTTLDELAGWLRVGRKDHLKARVQKLDAQRLALVHPTDGRYYITNGGQREVETRRLAQPG